MHVGGGEVVEGLILMALIVFVFFFCSMGQGGRILRSFRWSNG